MKGADMRKVIGLTFGFSLLMVSLGVAAAQSPDTKYTFSVIGVQPTVSPFWATVYKGVQAAGANPPVDVQYLEMNADQINSTGTVKTALGPQISALIVDYLRRTGG